MWGVLKYRMRSPRNAGLNYAFFQIVVDLGRSWYYYALQSRGENAKQTSSGFVLIGQIYLDLASITKAPIRNSEKCILNVIT